MRDRVAPKVCPPQPALQVFVAFDHQALRVPRPVSFEHSEPGPVSFEHSSSPGIAHWSAETTRSPMDSVGGRKDRPLRPTDGSGVGVGAPGGFGIFRYTPFSFPHEPPPGLSLEDASGNVVSLFLETGASKASDSNSSWTDQDPAFLSEAFDCQTNRKRNFSRQRP